MFDWPLITSNWPKIGNMFNILCKQHQIWRLWQSTRSHDLADGRLKRLKRSLIRCSRRSEGLEKRPVHCENRRASQTVPRPRIQPLRQNSPMTRMNTAKLQNVPPSSSHGSQKIRFQTFKAWGMFCFKREAFPIHPVKHLSPHTGAEVNNTMKSKLFVSVQRAKCHEFPFNNLCVCETQRDRESVDKEEVQRAAQLLTQTKINMSSKKWKENSLLCTDAVTDESECYCADNSKHTRSWAKVTLDAWQKQLFWLLL